jgi:hypothetical protein
MSELIAYIVQRLLILVAVYLAIMAGLLWMAAPAKPEPSRLDQYLEAHDTQKYLM